VPGSMCGNTGPNTSPLTAGAQIERRIARFASLGHRPIGASHEPSSLSKDDSFKWVAGVRRSASEDALPDASLALFEAAPLALAGLAKVTRSVSEGTGSLRERPSLTLRVTISASRRKASLATSRLALRTQYVRLTGAVQAGTGGNFQGGGRVQSRIGARRVFTDSA
jgi:hypothetical protein